MPTTSRSRQFLQKLGARISTCEDRSWSWNRSHTLAGEIGVTGATMSRYRLGKTEPRLETLEKIAVVARVNFEWLALGEGQPDCPIDGRIVLDERNFLRIGILDHKGTYSPEAVWGYIARACFSNLPNVPPEQPVIGGPRLAAFLINEELQGQKFPCGMWVLVNLGWTAPAAGWFCLKGLSETAYVRELDLDDDGAIDVVWPRSARPAEVKQYNAATFLTRFSVIGRVLGPLFVP